MHNTFFQSKIYRRAFERTMRNPRRNARRKKLCADVYGEVVEVGVGTGANLSWYGDKVRHLYAIDKYPPLFSLTSPLFPVTFIQSCGLPWNIKENSIDCVVLSYVLCSVLDTKFIFSEIRRILKKGGRIYFLEHGVCSKSAVRYLQRALSLFTQIVDDGCRIDKDIITLLTRAGFDVIRHTVTRVSFLECEYEGVAKKG